MTPTPTDTSPEDLDAPDSERKEGCSAMSGSDVWEYFPYRASLHLNGKCFAFITPDGRNALSAADAAKLLTALNRPNTNCGGAEK